MSGVSATRKPWISKSCQLCGAWRGHLGLEPTPELYVDHLTQIFIEVKRVLRNDGTLWLNIGDSYASGKGTCYNPGGGETSLGKGRKVESAHPLDRGSKSTLAQSGLKPKDLCGIPWRVAFALQADGWYLRSDIIWAKPNPMPESVTDRPTRSHEYIFLMAKSARYYYDAAAIKEDSVTGDLRKPYAPGQFDIRGNGHDRGGGTIKKPAGWDTDPGSHGRFHREGRAKPDKQRGHSRRHAGLNDRWDAKNLQNKGQANHSMHVNRANGKGEPQTNGKRNKRSVWTIATHPYPEAHFATFPEKLIEPCILAGCPERGIVLDPFLGSGTTAAVALRLRRQFVGIELNLEYIRLAEKRIAPLLA